LSELFKPRLTRYIPHAPTPKQRAFLLLPHREAFFGGAAGGGKSDALLMSALQYVDIPGYAALIMRRTLSDAKKSSSLLFRAERWLSGTDAVYDRDRYTFYFPSGAILSFGKCSNVGDAYQFEGTEWQYIGWDEVTQFYEEDFEFINSRLRKPGCRLHGKSPDSACASCREYAGLAIVPLRIRTAANPGGQGHHWVKARYQIDKVEGQVGPSGRPLYCGQNREKPHIPSFVQDNPNLDKDYIDHLSHIKDPVTREQLLAGDWGVTEEGRFKPSWMRRFNQRGNWFELVDKSETWKENELRTFAIVDPAASKSSTPGEKQLTKKVSSFTAIGVFSTTPRWDLLIRRVYRHQKEVPETRNLLKKILQEYSAVGFIGMELSTMSTHLFQVFQGEGFPMRAFSPYTGDKIARSVDASNRMESGKIYCPSERSDWLSSFEAEVFCWTGDPVETDDQVDILSYAAIYVSQNAPKTHGKGAIPAIV
jgi:predicted phage terminase large subunit-like protein